MKSSAIGLPGIRSDKSETTSLGRSASTRKWARVKLNTIDSSSCVSSTASTAIPPSSWRSVSTSGSTWLRTRMRPMT